MLTSTMRLAVPGPPKPKGSLKCIGGRGRHQLIEDNKAAGPWRKTIADAVRRKWPEHQYADPGQPVGAELIFTVDRPAGHHGTGRNAGVVKASAPAFPVARSSYDLDKLVRLALDALQDTPVLPDDAAVAQIEARKTYPRQDDGLDDDDVLQWPGVVIRLYPL